MADAERGVAARQKPSKRRSPSVKPAHKKAAKAHAPGDGHKRDEKPRRARLDDKDHIKATMEELLKSGGVADTTKLNLAQLKLQEMSLAKRIAAVAADIDSKRDEYRSIDSHELAGLLGIDDAHLPGGDWEFVSYIPRVPIEDICESQDEEEVLELLQPHVTAKRYEQINAKFGLIDRSKVGRGRLMSNLLTQIEKKRIEQAYLETRDQAYNSAVVAFYSIKGPRQKRLTFQASIEDDGGCIDLKTPYDERDGAFYDLSDC